MIVAPPLPSLEIQGKPLLTDAVAPIDGSRSPDLVLRGFPPQSRVTVSAVRDMEHWEGDAKGPWTKKKVRVVAWAKVECGRDGTVRLDRAKILSGSFTKSGSAGLFWSGYPVGSPKIPSDLSLPAGEVKEGQIAFRAVGGDRSVSGLADFRIPKGVRLVPIATPTLNGCFAYREGDRRKPALISLHGSEGSSVGSAQQRALNFASRGLPTLALNYFAWPHENVPNLSNSNLNTPVELLDTARLWLAERPEVAPKRIGLVGVSKGAEFSLVGASLFDWVKAVVAVVPTDVVWEGYPTPERKGRESTWSYRGEPLPYIPLYDPEPDRYRTNTERYERSRNDRPEAAKAAVIPLEKTRARVLLLAGDRDEVWASGAMSRRLAARMREFGKGRQIEAVVYPLAGHQISGPGLFPVRLYGVDSKDPRDKSIQAEGEATVDAWERTIRFFQRNL